MVYSLQNGQRPVRFDDSIFRSRGILLLFDKEVINNITARLSEPCQVGGFRHFTIYVNLASTSTPDLIHIEVEFLDVHTSRWHTYKQGLFAALFYEDTDCATELLEMFNGDCAGRDFRVKLTGVNVAASGNVLSNTKYFTANIAVEFWN